MPELRWTLLIIGVVFLAGLAWWELRRSRGRDMGAAGESGGIGELTERPHDRALARDGLAGGPEALPAGYGLKQAADGIRHEPTISFPETHPRDALRELPVVEVSDDSLIGLRIDGTPEAESGPQVHEAEPIVPAPLPAADAGEALPLLGVAPLPAPADPIVEWPDESVRRIVALRIVASTDRFAGRAIRQALSAEGFVLGKLSIFHRAGPDGRAIVSAASLTKPGTFDRESIDMQRYVGLNLFAVLPGPLSASQTFDELVSSARNLGERLQGVLQDEQGEPLTPVRAAMIRESLADEAEASG